MNIKSALVITVLLLAMTASAVSNYGNNITIPGFISALYFAGDGGNITNIDAQKIPNLNGTVNISMQNATGGWNTSSMQVITNITLQDIYPSQVGGVMNIHGDLDPESTVANRAIGSPGNRWGLGYFVIMVATDTYGNIQPATANSGYVGKSDRKFDSGYINNLYVTNITTNGITNFGTGTTAPTALASGDTYFNSSKNKPCYWNGTFWNSYADVSGC